MPRFSPTSFTTEFVAARVREYMIANPPAGGQPPTQAQVEMAVNKYLMQFPPPAGPEGPMGPAGADGQDGESITGPTGPAGRDGIDGAQGPIGAAGANGVDGRTPELRRAADRIQWRYQGDSVWNDMLAMAELMPTDAQIQAAANAWLEVNPPAPGKDGESIVGATGPKGETGPQGPKGDRGETGATGSIGPTGPIGPQGLQGIQGNKGDTGATGANGDKGDKGDTGNTGATGATGAAGPVGATGPSPSLSVATPARALNTAFQISTTRPAFVSYSVRLNVTNPLLAGSSNIDAFLETATSAAGPWTVVATGRNLSSVGLAVSLALTTGNDIPLVGVIPAGNFARIRTVTAGTFVAPTLVAQQETIYQ